MSSEQPPAGPALLALAGAFSLAAAMGIGRFAFTPVLPLMLDEGLLDVAQAGWVAAANYAGYLAGALTAARVPVRSGALAVMSLLATAALTAAMAWPSPASWMPLRFLAGIASAWVFVATSVWCLGALSQSGASRASAWVYAGVGGGMALAGLHCLWASAAGLSSSSLWMQLGALAFGLALPALWVIGRETRPDIRTHRSPQAVDIEPGESAGTHPLVVCYGLMGFGYILPATFLPVLARGVVDDPRLFGLAWPVFGATAAISTLLAARLLRRETRLKAWAACQLLMGLGVLLPVLWTGVSTIAASALLVGGTFMVITLAGVQEMRARSRGNPARLVGRLTAAFAFGQMAGPVASALLLQAGPQGLTIALAMATAALLVSGAWLGRLATQRPFPSEVFHG